MEAKALSFTRRTKVCAGGTVRKISCVTPGGLVEFLSGDRISDPISEERSGKRGLASSRTAE
jgi:hypothetical protein